MGQSHGRHPGGIVGFMIAQPPQLGSGEGRDRNHSGPVDELIGTDLSDECSCCPVAAQIVPEQSIADDLSVSIESDEAVLLSADAHSCDVGESSCLGDRLLQCRPPGFGVDFGSGRVRGRAAAQDPACGRVDDDDLAALRRGVDAGNQSAIDAHGDSSVCAVICAAVCDCDPAGSRISRASASSTMATSRIPAAHAARTASAR